MKFIDIHAHVISQFDDGAKSDEISRKMLIKAMEEGVTDIICTPHFMIRKKYKTSYVDTQEVFNKFKQRMSDLSITLHLGNEIEIDESTDDYLMQKKVHTLANSNYVLIELPWASYKDEIDDYLYNIKILGYKIIIAHPERYEYVQKEYTFAARWIKEGYYLQINQNSLFEKDKKRISLRLIQENYVSFIATDAHSEKRSFHLKECYHYIVAKCGKNKAQALFYDNALCVLENKKIPVNKIQENNIFLGLFKK